MNVVFSWISGVCLLLISVYLFFSLPDFELKTYESGIASYYFSGIVSRLIPSLIAVCGVFLFFHKSSKFISSVSIFSLLLAGFVLFIEPSEAQIALPLAFIFTSKLKLMLLFGLSFIGLILTYFYPHHKKMKGLPVVISKFVLAIGLVTIIFAFHPLFPEEFQDITTKSLNETQELGIEKLNAPSKTLLAFFTTSCPYCEQAARKLSLLAKKEANFPEIKIYFAGTEEGVSDFFKYTHTSFPYQIIPQGHFMEITEGSFPKMLIYAQDGSPIYLSGRSFNYAAPQLIIDNSH